MREGCARLGRDRQEDEEVALLAEDSLKSASFMQRIHIERSLSPGDPLKEEASATCAVTP